MSDEQATNEPVTEEETTDTLEVDESTEDTDNPEGSEHLGDPGKKALDTMKAAKKAAEARAKELEEKLKGYEDANKSEAEKAEEARTQLAKRAETAERELMRLKVAYKHGLTEAQAKRLVGDTEEDLEADAVELASWVKPARGEKPVAKLRGGATPNEEPEVTDPAGLGDLIMKKVRR